MKVLITGTTHGIGRATALKFIENNHIVYGLDIEDNSICHHNYHHIKCDVGIKETLPEIPDIDVVINNAGTVDETRAINVNLEGYINVVEQYALQPNIKSVVNVASISGHTGLDGCRYASSQGGRLAFTKYLAMELGNKYKALVNSVSPGAVMTNLEPELYAKPHLVEAVANENILKKWIKPEEVAELIYYLAVVNKSITGQDFLIDNGETANYNFIRKED